MIALFYYLLKVVLCSGILFAYYQLALKDKIFHQWNRFYLLGSVVVAMLLPVLSISVYTPAQHQSTVISAMEIVTGADEYVNEVNSGSLFALTAETLAGLAYSFVSLVVLILFVYALFSIIRMIRRNERVAIEDFYFLNTTEQGTPFSFFRFLLWNKEIQLDTENGRRILEHELVHIREKHSWDKIFIQLVLVLFWINPFFWLIRKELTLIHEFIADRKAVGNGDADAFAKLLLETSFPGYAPMLSNTFFKTSIKRRLSMITKQQHPGFTYLSRLMLIPIVLMLLFAFGVKTKTALNETNTAAALEQKVTVIIDAGHGGDDAGAISDGVSEKDLTINIATLVSELNRNPNIKIVLTRNADEPISVRDRVNMTDANKANLFLSIHTMSAPNKKEGGITAYISGRDFSKRQQNVRFATLLLKNVSMIYPTDKAIKEQSKKGVWVLDENVCPSVMLQCGFITNASDRKFMTTKQNQEKIARQILQSIEDYFSKSMLIQPSQSKLMLAADSVPAKKLKNVTLTYDDGTKETISPEEYRKKIGSKTFTTISDSIVVKGKTLQPSQKLPENTVYIIDGKVTTATVVESLDPNKISSMSVNKPNTEPGTITIITRGAASGGNVSAVTNTVVSDNVNTTTNVVRASSSPSANVNVTGVASTNTNSEGQDGKVTGVTIVNTNNEGQGVKVSTVNGEQPLYVLNGEEITEAEMKAIDTNKIESINILKGENATKSYGKKAKNGVVLFTLKK